MRVCSACRRCYDDSVSYCTEEIHPALSEARSGDPEMIDGYRLDSLLESNQRSEIYRAIQTASRHSCLVTIVRADDSFLNDAKLATRLFNQSIVDAYEAGALLEGDCYIVTEDPDGRTLREFLDDVGQPELLTSIEIIRQTAEALHSIHLTGLTHGAIRPENIVLTTDDASGLLVRIQNIDFGGVVARSIIANKFLIDSELKSLRYFSPEQCAGDGTSPLTDVYALGIVFYELLAGSPPFDAPKATALIQKHRSETVPDIRIADFELRMLVTHSLMEALQKQPRLRQNSANLFARQLRHIEQLATHVSTPPPAGVVPKSPALPKPIEVPVVISSPSIPELVPTASLRSEIIESTPVESKERREEAFTAEIVSEPVVVNEVDAVEGFEVEERSDEHAPNPIVAPAHIYLTPRSRLKRWKKKLHSIAARLAAETLSAMPQPIAESVDSEPERVELARPVQEERAIARKKIEWVTPDDDIPSVETALEVLAQEGASHETELTAAASSLEIPEVPIEVVKRIEKVEVARPRVTEPVAIPTIEKFAEPEAIEKPIVKTPIEIEPPAVNAPVERATAIPTPKIREQKQVAPVRLVPRISPKEEPAIVVSAPAITAATVQKPVAKTARKPAPKKSGLGFPVNLADLEEITLVRPPSKRIRIDWDAAAALENYSRLPSAPQPRAVSREVEFSPTILGGTSKRKFVEPERTEGMFSEHYQGTGRRVTNRNRSMMLGAGFVALLALFLFGNDSATKYFQTWSSADSISTSDTKPNEASPVLASLDPTRKPRRLKNSESRGPELAVTNRVNEKPRTIETPAPRKTVKTVSAPAPEVKKKSATTRPATPEDKKVRIVPQKPSTSTRPRIVKTQH